MPWTLFERLECPYSGPVQYWTIQVKPLTAACLQDVPCLLAGKACDNNNDNVRPVQQVGLNCVVQHIKDKTVTNRSISRRFRSSLPSSPEFAFCWLGFLQSLTFSEGRKEGRLHHSSRLGLIG